MGSWKRGLLQAALILVWSALAVTGLALTGIGVSQSSYFVATEEELEKVRVGRLLILSGCIALIVTAAWARWMSAPTWAWILVASPAMVVGGLTLALGNSLVPLLSALVVFPIAVVGMISVLVLARQRK